jgi:hypothetical protein
MRFARFWKVVKNDSGNVSARGWSDQSEEEAGRLAQERLARILNFLANPETRELDRYQYTINDVICEEVIDRMEADDGHEHAVISRNAYGSLVLNATRVMFIDIDIESTIPRVGLVGRLFGKQAPSAAAIAEEKLTRVREWQDQHTDYAFRVYRTAAGLRLIVPNRIFDSIGPAEFRVMEELNSDPLYRQLCRSQKCFRARLTPKPWRIGLKSPGVKFPFSESGSRQAFDEWYRLYSDRAKQWAVCEYVEHIGQNTMHPSAAPIIELHDSFCCSPGLNLA